MLMSHSNLPNPSIVNELDATLYNRNGNERRFDDLTLSPLEKASQNLIKVSNHIQWDIPDEYRALFLQKLDKIFIKIIGHMKGMGNNKITNGFFQRVCSTTILQLDDLILQLEDEYAENQKQNQLWPVQPFEKVPKWKKRQQRKPEARHRTLEEDPLPLNTSLERCPFYFVDNLECLQYLSHQLSRHKKFAFDLERTVPYYIGNQPPFVCLVQFSTAEEDFVVDVLQRSIRDNMRNFLKIPFEDPEIIKIVHGTDDKNWLKKDFGIVVKNIFDTSTAYMGSLQDMVYYYCGHFLNKKFQTANWLKRPLTDEMIEYARLDTHFLIPCYEKLKMRRK